MTGTSKSRTPRPTRRETPRRRRVEHPTPEQRAAGGKEARAKVPRSSHAELPDRPRGRDPIALLESQAPSRVPELVPIRYGRMLVSPFTFFRGAALVMADDLAATPSTGIEVQACGDAHLANFGFFASPERRLVFDLNDFDETLPGPWEWDVKRLAASLAVAGRDRGYAEKERARVVARAARTYRETMRDLAGRPNLEVWYAHFDVEAAIAEFQDKVGRKVRERAERNVAKMRTKDSMKAFEKLTTMVDGEPRIAADPPLIVPVEDLVTGVEHSRLVDELREVLGSYRETLQGDRRHLLEQFRFVHLARKVVGVGSVGTRCWIALMMGRDGGDPLMLQIKEAQPSVLQGYARRSRFANDGERVVVGQRLMQAVSDILLGWIRVTGIDGVERDFYVRQLKDWKGSAEIEGMPPAAMEIYARICGWTLARAHARSGDRIAIAAYLGGGETFDRAIVELAEAYADRSERDHAALLAAVDEGRITAETGI